MLSFTNNFSANSAANPRQRQIIMTLHFYRRKCSPY